MRETAEQTTNRSQPAAGAGTENKSATGLVDAHQLLVSSVLQKMSVLSRMMRLVFRRVMAESEAAGLDIEKVGSGQHRILVVLAEGGPMRSGVLAERCHSSEPNVSKMLKGIEAAGLIERRTDPENRRVVWVSLTPRGTDVCQSVKASAERALADILDPLNSRQLSDLITTFTHLEELVAAAERTISPPVEEKEKGHN